MNNAKSGLQRKTGLLVAAMVLALGTASGGCGDGQETPDVVDSDIADNGGTVDLVVSDDVVDETTEQDVRPDTAVLDAQIEPGSLGWPCKDNEDCDSLFCVASNAGPICTVTCWSDCPSGYSCRSVAYTSPDVIFICVPDSTPVCDACTVDGQCGDGKCVTSGGSSFCTTSCSTADSCQDGFDCVDVADTGKFCVPMTGACDCRTGMDGVIKSCTVTNEIGSCGGLKECSELTGWSVCSAPTPIAEVCNGVDDDCNGIPDDGFESTHECDTTIADVGTCPGTERCLGTLGWVCDARTPALETCDYIDNDCDGNTDEDFKVEDQYLNDESCGACSRSCAGTLEHAVAQCSGDFASPQCVVKSCESGYHKVNEFQCISNMNTLCMPCIEDAGCLAEGGKCLLFEDGTYCAVPCGDGNSCPTGYFCDTSLADGEFTGQCVPTTGRCGCGEDNPNAVRSCTVIWQSEDFSTVTCLGLQTCGAGEWSECDLPGEACDGMDNDCDGMIDEDFKDIVSGAFTSDEHCGECFNNCGVLSYPHSGGTCFTEGVVPYCSIACDDGYVNVNGELIDGCECLLVPGIDVPDGVDTDCDGIDGSKGGGVFVSRSGSDIAAGTWEDPLKTIGAGIDKADAAGLSQVYVATGVYEESVELRAGVSIYGGYSPDFLSHNAALYESVIMAPQGSSAVTADGINDTDAATRLDGFTIYGVDATLSGTSSYTVYVRNCDARVTISNNRIIAGDGAGGTRGDAGEQGTNGASGGSGAAAFDVGDACTDSTSSGGAGGGMTCGGVVASGGNGGTSVCPDFDEDAPSSAPTYPYTQSVSSGTTGFSGDGPLGPTPGGSPGFDQLIYTGGGGCSNCVLPPAGITRVGQPGSDGQEGLDGMGGSGCLDTVGSVEAGEWVAAAAGPGTGGVAGTGGGGGGAGGGVETDAGCSAANAKFSDLGGSGGGGGSGACPGSGGMPGVSGGASIGLFVIQDEVLVSLPVVTGNTIRAGRGGNGGDGGNGGTGGAGGNGGAGGPDGSTNLSTYCAPGGGQGGNGGDGGNGGGGGGGCGGPSFCLHVTTTTGPALAGYAADTSCDTGLPGSGGMGGASLGAPGSTGTDGVSARDNFNDL